MKLRKIIAGVLAVVLMLTAVQIDKLALVQAEDTGRTTVSAADSDYADYLLLKNYAKNSTDAYFGQASTARGDLRYDYPSLYGEKYGVYSSWQTGRADKWPYIAFKINVEEAGMYTISTKVNMDPSDSIVHQTFGMIVNGATYVLEVEEGKEGATNMPVTISQEVYLTDGEHTVVFIDPMPRDTKTAEAYKGCYNDSTLGNYGKHYYPWFNYYEFSVSEGVVFSGQPSSLELQNAMTSYMRVEAEDETYVLNNGKYGTDVSKTYNVRYNSNGVKNDTETYTISGASESAIDDSASDPEKTVNTTQTYESLQKYLDKKVTSYVQYSVKAEKAGTYNIRVGAYVEGNGTMPYGTILVNDKPYKAQFSGNWNGYDAVNLAVELKEGVNLIRCVGITADQTKSDGWIGYDYLEVQKGLEVVTPGTTTSVSDLTTAILSNNLNTKKATQYGGFVRTNLYTDKPSVENLLEDSFTLMNRWPWISLKVNAPYDGFYDMSVSLFVDTASVSGQVGMVIDGQICESKTFTKGVNAKQVLNMSTYLTAGIHTIVLTTPIPELEETTAEVTDSNRGTYYPWGDFYGITLGGGLTALDPDASLVPVDKSGIEAENTEYVSYSGDYATTIKPGSSMGYAAQAILTNQKITLDNLSKDYIDWNGSSYVQFAVNAPEDGEYNISLRTMAECLASSTIETKPVVVVLAGGEVHKVQMTADWYEFEDINVKVNLKQGNNIINCITVAEEQPENVKIIYDYLTFDTTLSAVKVSDIKTPAEDTIAAGGEFVLFNKYKSNGSTLGSAEQGDLRYDKVTIESINIENLRRIPYAAIKVTAETSGYFDVQLVSNGMNTGNDDISDHIALIVDGTRIYSLGFEVSSSASMGATIYLTEGTHTLVFTTPMPETINEFEIGNGITHPWFNMASIELSKGLEVSKPTKAEVESPSYTRIEAEDETKATYNGGYENESDPVPTYEVASGKLMSGVEKANLTQSFSDLENNYLDKTSTAYVQYVVKAPEDGTYKIKVGFVANKADNTSVDKPYVTVLVNEDAYKAQYDETWGNIDVVDLEVKLKEGYNIIRCTSLTTDQAAYEATVDVWIDHDFLDIESSLIPVTQSISDAEVDKDDSKVVSNMYSNDANKGSGVLENASQGYMREDLPTIEKLKINALKNLEDWPWIAMRVSATENGYYDITLNIEMKTSGITSNHVGMFVDGQACGRAFKVASPSKVDATVYLTAGTHTIIFTTAMPETDNNLTGTSSNDYPWFNFGTVKLGTGLTLENDPDALESVKTRIEAEDSTKTTSNIYAKEEDSKASNSYVVGGVKRGNLRQKLNELSIYMDKYSTPYVQYAIEAPKKGVYVINVCAFVNGSSNDNYNLADVAVPYVGVWANGNVVKAQFETWGSFNETVVEVELEEGINFVRVTGLTTEQESFKNVSCWINHDYIEVESSLTVVDASTLPQAETFNAGDAIDTDDKVLSNLFTDGTNTDDDKLGGAARSDMQYDRASLESLLSLNLNRVPYAATKVNAEEDGFYDIFMTILNDTDVAADETTGTAAKVVSKQLGLVVDGQNVYTVYISGGGPQTVGATIYLEAGTHVIVATTPMPIDNATAEGLYYPDASDKNPDWSEMKAAYPWCDYHSFTVDGRLTVDTTAPTIDEVYCKEVLIGDANDDGSVDNEDAERLRRYMVGLTVEINLEAADVRGERLYDCKNLVAMKKLIHNMAEGPVAYVSDYNTTFRLQNADYITTYSVDSEEDTNRSGTRIEVNTENTYQEIHGFGASITDTSALILSSMTETEKNDVMKKLFDKENGIGLSLLRNTIGASDFTSSEYYTYWDVEEDGFQDFSTIEGKGKEVVSLTKEALGLNGDLKLFLAPWTAPLWMKDDDVWGSLADSFLAGTYANLTETNYANYAEYLTKTVQVYDNNDIPVYAISVQNEPYTEQTYPAMNWTQTALVNFTNNNLKPALTNAGLTTKILNWDYNFEGNEAADAIMEATIENADGVGYHWYSGEPEEMLSTYNTYSNHGKLMYVTEASSSKPSNAESLVEITSNIARSLRSGANGFIMWNIALDPDGGPTYENIQEHCSALVHYDYDAEGTKELTYTYDYYSLAHFSKFMDTNAVRVESTDTGVESDYNLVNVVVQNPDDGSMTAVITNSDSNDSEVCKLVSNGQVMEVTVAPRSTVTITWNPNN